MTKYNIEVSRKQLVNLDPQQRCYNGYYINSAWEWSTWSVVETISHEHKDKRLRFWRELNEFATQEGQLAKRYRAVKVGDDYERDQELTSPYGDNNHPLPPMEYHKRTYGDHVDESNIILE